MYEDKQWSWVCCKYPTEMNTLHVIQGFSKATPSRITDTHVLLMIPRNFELKISSKSIESKLFRVCYLRTEVDNL